MTYKKSSPLSGRIDGNKPEMLRWHQVIEYVDLEKEKLPAAENGIVFLEFAVDEGVRRNQGRVGAKDGAQAISRAMANFPVHRDLCFGIFHGGVISCEDGNLEEAQAELAFFVEKILRQNCLPIVLGGGHEVTYGHYSGIKNFLLQGEQGGNKIGIINFDAHFDIRPVEESVGATSGTSVWQIANEIEKNGDSFNYLALGIQKYSNTKLLFDLADKFGAQYAMGDSFNYEEKEQLLQKITNFINSVEYVYLTICMDVFAACFAPGVSAPSPSGIAPDFIFMSCFDLIVSSKKLISFDIAETNPQFDIDSRTAKLAASLVFRLCSNQPGSR